MLKASIVWSTLIGLAVVAWYRPLIEVASYIGLVMIGLWIYGSILLDRNRKKPTKSAKELMRDEILKSIDISCDVKSCDEISEITCADVHVCTKHWRMLRARGFKHTWNYKQEKDK